jgi:hypothetical protein
MRRCVLIILPAGAVVALLPTRAVDAGPGSAALPCPLRRIPGEGLPTEVQAGA